MPGDVVGSTIPSSPASVPAGAPPQDPAGGPGGSTGASPPTAGSRPSGAVALQFGFSVGVEITGQTASVTARGLEPGTLSLISLHSAPRVLGSATVGPDGSFSTVVHFPAGIEAGAHHVDVTGTTGAGAPVAGRWYLAVNRRGVVTHLDTTSRTSTPRWAATLYPPYAVTEHAPTTVAIMVSGFALLAVITGGASLVHAAAPNSGGSMASSKVKHAKRWRGEDGAGDRSATWRWPGVGRLDRLGTSIPARLGPISPLAARISVDSTWLRAMFGPLWLALPSVGVALGTASALDVRAAAIPPSVALVTAIVVLSALDSLAGMAAAAVFTLGVLVGGGVTSLGAVRGLLGVDMLFFVVPLIASAARPLRRKPSTKPSDWFDRVADVVIVSLIAGWSTEKIVGGLSGLAGLTLPIDAHAKLIALAALVAMATRMVGETAASTWYPSRLEAVTPEEIGSAATRQQVVSLGLQTLLMLFIAVAYLGNVWELYVGAALFAGPSIFKMYEDCIRNVPWLVRALPAGMVKTVLMMIVGTWFAELVAARFANPARFITEGFVVLSVPGLLLGSLSLLAREGRKWEPGWMLRIAGIGVLGLGVLLTQKVVRIG